MYCNKNIRTVSESQFSLEMNHRNGDTMYFCHKKALCSHLHRTEQLDLDLILQRLAIVNCLLCLKKVIWFHLLHNNKIVYVILTIQLTSCCSFVKNAEAVVKQMLSSPFFKSKNIWQTHCFFSFIILKSSSSLCLTDTSKLLSGLDWQLTFISQNLGTLSVSFSPRYNRSSSLDTNKVIPVFYPEAVVPLTGYKTGGH